MKKLTSILIVILILFNSCGYIFIYSELSKFFKEEAFSKINEYIPNNQLEIITINKNDLNNPNSPVRFINDKEIRYYDEYYDIYKKIVANDKIYLYCINDKNEKNLERAFSDYVEQKTHQNSKGTPIHNIISNIIKVANIPIIFNDNFYQKSINFTILIVNLLPQYSLDIPTPPPKHFC